MAVAVLYNVHMQALSPLHSTTLGSGLHCPFAIHVDVLDPTSSRSGGQIKYTVLPSLAGFL